MKKILIAVACCLLILSAPAFAATLMWDAPSPCGDPDTCPVDGYVVYYGEVGGDVTYHVKVTDGEQQQLSPLNLQIGKKYRFAVSDYNAAGESAPCDPVEYAVPAYSPGEDVLPPGELVIKLPNGITSLRFEIDN